MHFVRILCKFASRLCSLENEGHAQRHPLMSKLLDLQLPLPHYYFSIMLVNGNRSSNKVNLISPLHIMLIVSVSNGVTVPSFPATLLIATGSSLLVTFVDMGMEFEYGDRVLFCKIKLLTNRCWRCLQRACYN